MALGLLLATARGSNAGDDLAHIATAEGWLTRGTSALPDDGYKMGLITVKGPGGRLYSNLDAGMPALLLPFVAGAYLADRLGGRPVGGDLLDHYAMRPPFPTGPMHAVEAMRSWQRDPRVLSADVAAPVAGALAVLFLLLALREVGFNWRVVAAAAAALALGWPILVYAGTLWTQIPALACLAAAFWALTRLETAGGWLPAMGVGLAAGLAALFRFDLWLVAPVLGVAAGLAGWRHRTLGRVLAAFVGGLAVAAACYASWALATRGVLRPARRGVFITPLWQGALLVTVSPAKGVLFFAPWLLLAPVGVRALARRSPGLAIAAVGCFLVQFCTVAKWFDWGSSGVDPVLWSPSRCGRRIPRCPARSPRTPLTSAHG